MVHTVGFLGAPPGVVLCSETSRSTTRDWEQVRSDQGGGGGGGRAFSGFGPSTKHTSSGKKAFASKK